MKNKLNKHYSNLRENALGSAGTPAARSKAGAKRLLRGVLPWGSGRKLWLSRAGGGGEGGLADGGEKEDDMGEAPL